MRSAFTPSIRSLRLWMFATLALVPQEQGYFGKICGFSTITLIGSSTALSFASMASSS